MNNWQAKKLFIAGIPGSGKTRVGNHLQDKYEFVHIDMESKNNISMIIQNRQTFINNLLSYKKNIVMTWGFIPNDQQIAIVSDLVNKNFELIWFDGDRDAARREFIKRDSQFGNEHLNGQLSALNLQMKRIEESNVVDRLNWKIVNTFDDFHNFRSLDEIINQIIND